MYNISEGSEKVKMTAKRELVCFMLLGLFIFIVGLVGGIIIGIYAYHGGPDAEVNCKNLPQAQSGTAVPATTTKAPQTTTKNPDTDTCSTCHRDEPRKDWDGKDPEIFAPLTEEEMAKVYDFLKTNNMVSTGELTIRSNYVHAMYMHVPEKEAVLKYKQGIGPYPGRYAHAHMIRGNRTNPDYMEYKIGPLGGGTMMARQLYQDGELSFNSRPFLYEELDEYYKLLKPDFATLAPLTKESFDGVTYPESSDFEIYFLGGSVGTTPGEREARFAARLNPLAEHGHDTIESDYLPLTGVVRCTGVDVRTWYIYDYYYLNQGPFKNASALMDAYIRGTLRKFALPNGYRETVLDRHLPDRDTEALFRHKSDHPPPRVYEPAGPRYTITGHHVEWMDWSFDVTSGQLMGPAIYLVNFDGESIAYEIALNEIALVYGSGSPAQTNIFYADSLYAVGENDVAIRSVDCPEHATVLETRHWDYWENMPDKNPSICIFEADGQNALWRHYGLAYKGGLRNSYLVVRFSTTIYNYDYVMEWHFLLDGRIFTLTSATGFIQGAFWDKNNNWIGQDKSRDAFGYRVSDFTQGLIHDHMFGFKVDLDILGTDNTMESIHWKAGTPVSALQSQVPTINQAPSFFMYNETRYVKYEYIEREVGMKMSIEDPKFWVVVNENATNKWGAKRGYQIKPLSTAIQTLTSAHPALPALSFTKYHCAVTKRKEREPSLTSTTDSHRLDNPVRFVDQMLDNEYIRNADIVHWINTGFFHVPTSEDIPMTTAVTSGFLLKPFNFFDKTRVFDMPAYLDTEGDWRTERPPPAEPCLEPKYTP